MGVWLRLVLGIELGCWNVVRIRDIVRDVAKFRERHLVTFGIRGWLGCGYD